MDKEKEIDRMVEIAREYSKDIANTPYYKGVVTDMTALYEADYRKAVEVRKETAKEILEMLVGHTLVNEVGGRWTWTIGTDDVRFIAEKYGVEVDE